MSNDINIYDVLDHIEKNKAMYLGNEYTFQSLNAFLTGFSMSANSKQYQSDIYNNFLDFNVWLLGYLPKHFGQGGGWHWQLSNRNPNNDENAFKEFFEFVRIFKLSKSKVEQIKIKPFKFKKTQLDIKTKIETKKEEMVSCINKITIENSSAIWVKGYHQNNLIYNKWCLTEVVFNNMINNMHLKC